MNIVKTSALLAIGTIFTANVASANVCSKEEAVKQVTKVCSDIEAKGAAVKADWPKSLLFPNCGDNYIWVQDTSPEIKMVMHPIKQRLNDTSLLATTDDNKFPLFAEFGKAAVKNPAGAWVDYLWTKPGGEKATAKTSFVKLCKAKDGTSWIAGSGIWKDDVK